VDLSKFLYSVDSSACNIRHVASTENLRAYLEKLRSCHVGPSGQINKLSVFKRAIQYLILKIQENPTEEDRDTMLKCNLAIAEAVAYTKAIQKEKKGVSEMKQLLAKKTLTMEVSTFKV